MSFITKRHIPRRTFLKGTGVTLALPLLEAMVPASTALAQLSPDGLMDLNLTSPAAGVTRHYDVAADMQHDAIDARVFSGIHFRTSDEVGATTGTRVANWALDHYFAPAN